MFGLEKLADEFDRIYESSQRAATDTLLVRPGRWSGDTFGPDSTVGMFVGILPAALWTIYTFAAGAGKGLVDVLRLGEGVKSGTASGVLQDGIRVLNLLPAVGMAAKGLGVAAGEAGTMGRFASAAWAARVAGGEYQMSCGVTSSAVAMRVSGQRVLMTLDEFGKALGKGSPTAESFPGVTFDELLPALKTVGARATEIKAPGASLQTIKQIAGQGKGPVVIGVRWWKTGGLDILQPVQPLGWDAADHFLAAFKNARGEIMVADQFGVRPIAELGKIGGGVTQFSLTSRILQFENVGFASAAEKLAATGARAITAGGKLTATANPALRNWLTLTLGIEMVTVSKPVADNLDATIRQKLGRPPRPAAAQPQAPSAPMRPSGGASAFGPAGSGQHERDLIRKLMAPVNSRTPIDEIFPPLLNAGYSRGRIFVVLEEMEKSGEIELMRRGTGNVTYVIRRR